MGDSINEIKAVTEFLIHNNPETFTRLSDDVLLASSIRETLTICSIIKSSFFIRKSENGTLTDYRPSLSDVFASYWVSDLKKVDPELFRKPKTIRFVKSWIQPGGYTNASYSRKRKQEMLSQLDEESEESGYDTEHVLYILQQQYASRGPSYQFDESVYHYIFGSVLRDAGYLVLDEYNPSFFTNGVPDLSAFKTAEINEYLPIMKKKGLIRNGAFLVELQMLSLAEVASHAKATNELANAESMVVGIKRKDSTTTIKKGFDSVLKYFSDASTLYAEAYLAAPFLTEQDNELNPLGLGTLTVNEKGDIISKKSKNFNLPQPSDFMLNQRRAQLSDIKISLVLQLIKNVPLYESINLCSQIHRATSYSDFIDCLNQTEPEKLIDFIENKKNQPPLSNRLGTTL